jgi:hypothetical protein
VRRRCGPDEAAALCELLDVWRNCQQTLTEGSRLMGYDLTRVGLANGPLHDRLLVLVEKLRELRDAFESRDGGMVADLLRYELGEMAEPWSQALTELAGQLNRPAAVR